MLYACQVNSVLGCPRGACKLITLLIKYSADLMPIQGTKKNIKTHIGFCTHFSFDLMGTEDCLSEDIALKKTVATD